MRRGYTHTTISPQPVFTQSVGTSSISPQPIPTQSVGTSSISPQPIPTQSVGTSKNHRTYSHAEHGNEHKQECGDALWGGQRRRDA